MTMPAAGMSEGLAQIVEPLLDWYRENARDLPWRENTDPYQVWVSEIMLQQTRVTAAIPYFLRFREALPTLSALAECPEERLMKLWEGLGYYTRARNMQKAARMVMEEFGGGLPPSFEKLKTLPGVGEYTAGAVASIAFGLPVPAVDGNVLRVVSRLLASRRDIALPQVKKDVTGALALIIPRECPGDFTQAVMELGACVCLPGGAPLCHSCPLGHLCAARAEGIQAELPVKAPKKPVREETHTVFILVRDGKIALHRRLESGLLAGLWQPPMAPGTLGRQAAAGVLDEMGLSGDSRLFSALPKGRHLFTHIRWELTGWAARVEGPGRPDFSWFTPEELRERAAVPSAFDCCLKEAALAGILEKLKAAGTDNN